MATQGLPPLPFGGAPITYRTCVEQRQSKKLMAVDGKDVAVPATQPSQAAAQSKQLEQKPLTQRAAAPLTAAHGMSAAMCTKPPKPQRAPSIASQAPSYPTTAVTSRAKSVTSSQYNAWLERMEALETEVHSCAFASTHC
jgi:hypothetical protein